MELAKEIPGYPGLDPSELQKDLSSEYRSLQSGYDSAKVRREQAYLRYSMQKYGNEVEGRSQSVDSTIFDKVEWLTAVLLRPVMEGDDAMEIVPEGIKDVPASEYLRELITYQFKKKNDYFLFNHSMIKQAQIGGDSYCKLHWEPRTKEYGAAYVKLEALPPWQIRYDWTKSNFYDSDVIIHETDITASDLKEMAKDKKGGYITSNIDYILDNDMGKGSEDATYSANSTGQRERVQSRTWVGDGLEVSDKASMYYRQCEHWTKKDIDGTGIRKPVVCTYVNDILIRFTENPYPDGKPPFAHYQCVREPFSSLGWSQADILGDIQQNITAINRDIIDNLASQTNGMWEVDTNFVDPQGVRLLREGRSGSVIPTSRPQSINPLQPLPIAPQVFQYRSLLQQDADGRSGFTKSESMDTKLLRSTATAANIVSTSSQLRVWEMAQRYVEMLKVITRKTIAYNQAWLDETSIQRVFGKGAGEWIFPDKKDIAGNFAVDIQIALAGDKQEKISNMMNYAQYVGPYAQQIPEISDALQYMSAKMANLMGMKDFEAFLEEKRSGYRGAVYPSIINPEQGYDEGAAGLGAGGIEEQLMAAGTGEDALGLAGAEELAGLEQILPGGGDLGEEPV